MRVLVTGATGFLGSHTARRLSADGHTVRALVRKTSHTAELEALGAELVVGSLDTGEGLDDALDGVDAVIDLAGGGKVRRMSDFYTGNVDTTAHLLAAVDRVKPDLARFVHCSSLAAHGPSPDGQPRDPDDAPQPVTHYGKSKAQAEALVLERAADMPITVIRPPAVYGPGDRGMLTLYKTIDRRGFMPLVGRGHAISIVWVGDCVDAIVRALEVDHPSGRTYFVEDGRTWTHEDIGRHIGLALNGRDPRTLRLPFFLFAVAATVSELTGKLSGQKRGLTRDKIRDVRQRYWICSADRTREDLGWEPTVTFDEGVKVTADWYRAQGWL